MTNKMERMSSEALSRVPSAAERLIASAEKSKEVAKQARAGVRRQRMTSQQSFAAVRPELLAPVPVAAPESEEGSEPELAMPSTWRDDEPTLRTTLPHDEKFDKKKIT